MTGTTDNSPPYLIHDGNKLTDPDQQEPIYRNHWKTIFSDTDPDDNNFDYDHIETISQTIRLDLISPFNNSDLSRLDPDTCPPIEINEINQTISKLKNKAPGPNGLTARQLKALPDNMTHYLKDIFNNSLSAGYFPDIYKKATMIFIPKTGSPDVKDKRPISLLNIDGKILDRILNRRLTHFMDNKRTTKPPTTRLQTGQRYRDSNYDNSRNNSKSLRTTTQSRLSM